jgi:hypothetical protein
MNPMQQFIESEDYCLCCGNKMTLFMQIKGWGPFKAKEEYPIPDFLYEGTRDQRQVTFIMPPPRKLRFAPMDGTSTKWDEVYGTYNNSPNEASPAYGDAIEAYLGESKFIICPLTSRIRTKINVTPIYLFYVCNPDSVVKSTAKVNVYNVCSHKSSSSIQLKGEQAFDAQTTNSDAPLISHETFSFHKNVNDIEKTYIINLNHEKKLTNFYYFTATQKQKDDPNYRPTLLQKELPFLNKRPDFSLKNRDALINKFESWVIMS